MQKKKLWLPLILLCAMLGACASNASIRLLYPSADSPILPAPTAPRLVVVLFENARQVAPIGVRRDGTPMMPSSMVVDWVSRSLADELARLGFQVSFAATMEQARAANPRYIVTGSVREAWVKEEGFTELSAKLQFTVKLASERGVLFTETLRGSQKKQGIVSSSMAEELLSSTLRDLLVPLARKIQESATKHTAS